MKIFSDRSFLPPRFACHMLPANLGNSEHRSPAFTKVFPGEHPEAIRKALAELKRRIRRSGRLAVATTF